MRRRARLALVAVLAALAARPALAQSGRLPVQQQIINLSLLEALVAVDAADLAGVFGFIPEDRASMAMADFLVHNHKALKKFIKKVERDFHDVRAINDWDRQVVLFLVGIHASGIVPPGVKPIPKGWMSRINELALAPALPLQIIVQKRAAR